jgi:hypothetical protein
MARYRVDEDLVNAVIRQESAGNHNAVSPKGARGLGQVMPKTAHDPGFGIKPLRSNAPEENVRFTADYLGAMLDKYDGNKALALAAYNAGPGAVDKHGGIPPYKETQNYVSKIMKALNPIGEASASETPYKPTRAEFMRMKQQGLQPQAPQTKIPTRAEFMAMKLAEKEQQPQQDTSLMHKAQVGLRGVAEGLSSVPGDLYNASQMIPQAIAGAIESKTGFRHPFMDSGLALPGSVDTEQFGSKVADMAGLDQPTDNDNIIYPVGKAVGSYVIPATAMSKMGGPGLKAAGKFLGGEIPGTSIVGITAGKTAAEIARQQDASPGTQLAADIAGNVTGGLGVGMAKAVGRVGTRASKAAIGAGLEGVAGRTLNRAAGEQSPQIVETLATGQVPTIKNAIKGYKPTASEIAGNPGISTIMRQTGLDVDSLSMLGDRKFSNAKSIVDYAKKATGSTEKLAKMQEKGFSAIDDIAKPMRERNLPVDVNRIRTSIDAALDKHKGNKAIESALNSLKKEIPEGETAGFNEVYNFKQYIDETLRGNALSDPKVASMQRAASALKGVKKELADSLAETEPGFKEYLKFQAVNVGKIGQRKAASKAIENAKVTNPFVSNLNGQEEVFPLSANKLSQVLKNEKAIKELSPAQVKIIKNAADHAKLQSRSNLGMMVGSNTAQNLSVKDAVFNDLMAAGIGEKPGIIGRSAKKVISAGTNLLSPMMLSKFSSENSQALSKIFTKAELDPKYAAELMKTYGLGHLNFNDSAGKAAMRAILTQGGKQ